jgi:5-methylcytosine-specific restriction protein A
VCDFDFGQEYGLIGEGFIHVHHIVPLSSVGPDYKIDPKQDLRPVCPNCHEMLHRRQPPYSIEELKQIMQHPIVSP